MTAAWAGGGPAEPAIAIAEAENDDGDADDGDAEDDDRGGEDEEAEEEAEDGGADVDDIVAVGAEARWGENAGPFPALANNADA